MPHAEQNHAPPLPLEIIDYILACIPPSDASQSTLCACALVSKVWYSAAIVRLYANPQIDGKNYDLFVASVCPSINAHIRTNGLGELVRILNLSKLVHHSSKSKTARLLGRVKNGVKEFVAPQASFGINALSALSKCYQLSRLDFSLVSQAFTLSELAHSLKNLESLDVLLLPRAGDGNYQRLSSCWPPKLRSCVISGGYPGRYVNMVQRPPQWDDWFMFPKRQSHSLRRLTIRNCHTFVALDIMSMLSNLPELEYFQVQAPMIQLQKVPLESHFLTLGTFRHLKIPVEFISPSIFGHAQGGPYQYPHPHPKGPGNSFVLDTLELDCIEPRQRTKSQYSADKIWDAVAEGALGNLRRLKVHHSVDASLSEKSKETRALDQYLKALAREDGATARFSEEQAGVWIFGT